MERGTREKMDFGLAPARRRDSFSRRVQRLPGRGRAGGHDLRALREHQMSADAAFLNRTWPKIKRATQWLIAKDANGDGLIESNQHNTLDTDWFGPVAWLSGLYLAALTAAAEMADEAGDAEFARECRGILETGRKNLVAQLFDGEYFINKVSPQTSGRDQFRHRLRD
jgi:non-lysosomal glucosylceramidase